MLPEDICAGSHNVTAMKTLFIGMPVYNGERFIGASIESIRSQTFKDWTMLISDNASTDGTAALCKEYAAKDSRIRYARHEKNSGGENNFKYLLDQADSRYFMWASDDLWEKEFIESCIAKLEQNPACGLAFSNIANIDSQDRVIRDYPSFSRFVSKNAWERTYSYLLDSEKMGKANLLYSIFRLELCRSAWAAAPFDGVWGSEMCFLSAALARAELGLDERVLFKKRIITPYSDFRRHDVTNAHERLFPFEHSKAYCDKTVQALKGTGLEAVGAKIMETRAYLVEAQSKVRNMSRWSTALKHPLRSGRGIFARIKNKIIS